MCISVFSSVTHVGKECIRQMLKNQHIFLNFLAIPQPGAPTAK